MHRNFAAAAPNQLWVTDLTFVPTWAGVAYVCFIIDAHSRMIVGWRVASHMRTSMVLDALEMARWSRGTTLQDLICHSDAGSQFTSIRYGERLAEIGAVPSIGTVGDSFDNALAETVNGYYKAELIYGPARSRPWKTVEDVELATLSWVHWHNTSRLHSYLGDIPPTEFEAAFYDAYRTDQPLIGIQSARASGKPRALQAKPGWLLGSAFATIAAGVMRRQSAHGSGAAIAGRTVPARRSVIEPEDKMISACATLRVKSNQIGQALGEKLHDGDRWIAAARHPPGGPIRLP
ncbi:integrase core domain protein [Mycobacterium xenopi 3993]|nr:integrase core domain protein [Mycobacterium xenopi 3993]